MIARKGHNGIGAPAIADRNRNAITADAVVHRIGEERLNGGIVARQLLPIEGKDRFAPMGKDRIYEYILLEEVARLPLN